MQLPPPFVRSQLATEPPALVRVVSREDVHWNRPAFKAPPLVVQPPLAEIRSFLADFRRGAR